ncbi:outer membrane protein transport protein [Vibrio plantisponsor]|jgi:long-chain fatty acid transport protein|uniref:Outer membrane protein transport protein n=1 Tax=Vibrio plantisponsor TaxID=664643 RepID=A0ABU4IDQ2_9VIBR|nr:outer membrane protein transport protein [Vibrio plantisponsor]MDW6016495.1 outer membrane protein transport protein [Vibrio plantisponsor]NNM41690.1 outer membrane protein transport protein [Vibrio plantisponsor]PNH90289.1 long-chain fatty acid transporter [Vibrio diazotrophicus]
MNKTRLFKRSLLAVTVTLATQQAMAAGFQLNAQSATGLGRAFAGDAVIADNASVMARNPAAMALFDKTELSLGFESITTMIEVKDAKYSSPLGTSTSIADTDDVGSTSVAPNIHLIVPIDEKFAVGVNAYTNFGTRTEFSSSYTASEYGGVTDVKSINFGLAGSYRLDEQLSFGAGIDLIYGQGTLQRYASSSSAALASYKLTNGASTTAVPAGTALVNIDGADGWAVGFNVGTVYELDENNRFGFGYHYSPDFKAKDDYGQEITLPLPDIAEFSGFHKIEDTSFAVHYSVQWIGWSSFDKIEMRNLKSGSLAGTNYDKPYEWQDGWHYSLGGTYYLNSDWTLRAGYMYDTSAQDSVTSISVPDSDRQWFSAGFTYAIDQASNVDFGFTYLLGDDVAVTENSAGTTLTATTHADAILVGLQYSRSF